MKNENGYALYLVLVLSFIIFMLVSHALFLYVNESRMVYLLEMDVRSQQLVQSAVSIWLVEEDGPELSKTIRLEDGEVVVHVTSQDEQIWELTVIGTLNHSAVTHRVDLMIDKATGRILHWRNV